MGSSENAGLTQVSPRNQSERRLLLFRRFGSRQRCRRWRTRRRDGGGGLLSEIGQGVGERLVLVGLEILGHVCSA